MIFACRSITFKQDTHIKNKRWIIETDTTESCLIYFLFNGFWKLWLRYRQKWWDYHSSVAKKHLWNVYFELSWEKEWEDKLGESFHIMIYCCHAVAAPRVTSCGALDGCGRYLWRLLPLHGVCSTGSQQHVMRAPLCFYQLCSASEYRSSKYVRSPETSLSSTSST